MAHPVRRATASWPDGAPSIERFRGTVLREGGLRYRDLPWRNIDDPYAVLVSEVMLQQTQVKRVLGYWPRFMAAFPTIDALAAADTADVLALWQGLGYNRRALALKRCADECASLRGGRLPETAEELKRLPGIGPATAGGEIAFAFDKPALYLETNVRAVFIHELFPECPSVSDRQIEPLVEMACPDRGCRAWYYALLDYGAHLKATVPNPSRRSAHHSRQSAFEGSRRQKRAELVRIVLAAGPDGIGEGAAAEMLDGREADSGRPSLAEGVFTSLAEELAAEGFFKREAGRLLP